MKFRSASACIFLSVSLLASCVYRAPHKPLMGGIRASATETTPAETGSDSYLPAPLTDRPEQILRREGYTASYNRDLRISNWVAWHLTGNHTTGPYSRKSVVFHEDMEVPDPRAADADYARSGYDRGHLCPSGDNKWSAKAQDDCFLFTNICPQSHNLNGGDWNDLEMQCRAWAREYGDLYIVTGPVLRGSQHRTIGRHKVTAPEGFYKMVLRMRGKPSALAFVYDNDDGHRPMSSYVVTVDEVESLTGIDFFPTLPDDVEQAVESRSDFQAW